MENISFLPLIERDDFWIYNNSTAPYKTQASY